MGILVTEISPLHIAIRFVKGGALGNGLVALRGQCSPPFLRIEARTKAERI